MSSAITIKVNVDLDYRFNYIDYEDLGGELIFEKSDFNLYAINYKRKPLTKPIDIPFSIVDKQLLNDGARVNFQVVSYDENESAGIKSVPFFQNVAQFFQKVKKLIMPRRFLKSLKVLLFQALEFTELN